MVHPSGHICFVGRVGVLQSPFPGSRRNLSLCPGGRGRPWPWEQMLASLLHFLEMFLGSSTGEAALYLVCSCPGFPQCERAHGFCKTVLSLLFNCNKESEILVFGGYEYHTCQNLVPVGLKAPDGGGTVWFCFPKSCEVGDTLKWGTD